MDGFRIVAVVVFKVVFGIVLWAVVTQVGAVRFAVGDGAFFFDPDCDVMCPCRDGSICSGSCAVGGGWRGDRCIGGIFNTEII